MTQEKRMKALEKIADVGGWGGGVRKSVGDIADVAIKEKADREAAIQDSLESKSKWQYYGGLGGIGLGLAKGGYGVGGVPQIFGKGVPGKARIAGAKRLLKGLGWAGALIPIGYDQYKRSAPTAEQAQAHGEEAQKWRNSSRWLKDVGRKLR